MTTSPRQPAAAAEPPFRHNGDVPPPIGKWTAERLSLQREIEEHLYYEADLLDQWRYRDWLELVTDDVRYWAPIRRNVRFGDWEREQSRELAELGWFDDNKATLEMRVRQLESGIHWSEEPLSRVCHIISNVRIVGAYPSIEDAEQVTVRCRFAVYRNHQQDEEGLLFGKREDVLRRRGDGWQLARRSILIDQSVLLAQNLTFLV